MILKILIGFISGLTLSLGLGGGLFLLIYLTTFLGINLFEAHATNLFFFIVVSILTIIFYIKNKLINFKIASFFLIYGILGMCVGLILKFVIVPSVWSNKIFAIFLFIIGLKELTIK